MFKRHRRPLSQIESLRRRCYHIASQFSRRLLKSRNDLGEAGEKVIKDPHVIQYVKSLLEFQANYDARALLDWYVGEGLPHTRYRNYFTEVDDSEIFEPTQVVQPDSIRHTVGMIDTLRKDERYDINNLPSREYTEDVIDHWIRRFWKVLRSSYGKDDDLYTIYIDLETAIGGLSPQQKDVVHWLCDGWKFNEIQREKGMTNPKKIYNEAKKKMIEVLKDGILPDIGNERDFILGLKVVHPNDVKHALNEEEESSEEFERGTNDGITSTNVRRDR